MLVRCSCGMLWMINIGNAEYFVLTQTLQCNTCSNVCRNQVRLSLMVLPCMTRACTELPCTQCRILTRTACAVIEFAVLRNCNVVSHSKRLQRPTDVVANIPRAINFTACFGKES
jgi:hypothetical protein